jgi:glycosyltransferase involved in cell wall biosynthesis
MRIVQLADYGGPYPGSFVPMLRAVGEAAASRGASYELVFTPLAAERPWFRQLVADGVTARTAPSRDRGPLAAWLSELVGERSEPTVLHTHFTAFDLPAVLAARRHSHAAVVWHLHTRFAPGVPAFARNAIKLGVAGRDTAAILCVSDDLRVEATRRLAPRDRLVAFTNAIDLEHFRPAREEERVSARAVLGVESRRPLLVHFGWDWETKGGDLFLAAFAELKQKGIDATALCVGGGEPAHAAAARHGLDGQVQVVGPRDDVRTFYAAADAFVSSSRAEGMSYAVLEALCTGTPVVASAIPSHVRLAARTDGCTVVEAQPVAFAAAIAEVLRTRAEGGLVVGPGALAEALDLRLWAERLLDLYAARTGA